MALVTREIWGYLDYTENLKKLKFLPYYFTTHTMFLDIFQSVRPQFLNETQLDGVTSLPLSPTLVFGEMNPLLHESQGSAGHESMGHRLSSAFRPLPLNSKHLQLQMTQCLYLRHK